MNQMMEIVAVKLDTKLENCKFKKLLTYLSNEKQERISKFYSFEDAQRSLIGDILARYLLCRRLKIQNKKLLFSLNEYGKPFLASHNHIHFNISHSGKWVVGCVDHLEIGIDVEQIKPIDIGIAERFFCKQEIKDLMSKNVMERVECFYDFWTLKESYIKAVGKGLSIPFDSFSIRVGVGDITICSMYESDNYYFKQYLIDENYKMAVCSRENKFPTDVEIIDVNEFYEDVLKSRIFE